MLPLFVAFIYKEYSSAVAFTIALAISIALGIVASGVFGRDTHSESLRYTDSYFIVTYAWIMSSILAAIPFVIQGSIPNITGTYGYKAYFQIFGHSTKPLHRLFPSHDSTYHPVAFRRNEFI